MAEAILNHNGKPNFTGFSAGSKPTGSVREEALDVLRSAGISTEGLRSKSWDEFAKPGAPRFDLVLTVCDNAAKETCPIWPGHPVTVHWGVPDPASATGSKEQIADAFRDAYLELHRRISLLLLLPLSILDEFVTKRELEKIGRS
jgi:arsenate reductase